MVLCSMILIFSINIDNSSKLYHGFQRVRFFNKKKKGATNECKSLVIQSLNVYGATRT